MRLVNRLATALALFLAATVQRVEAAPAPPVRIRPQPVVRWEGQWRMGIWQVCLGAGGGCTIHGTDDLYLGRWRTLPGGQIEIEEHRILDDGSQGEPYRYVVRRAGPGELAIVRHVPREER